MQTTSRGLQQAFPASMVDEGYPNRHQTPNKGQRHERHILRMMSAACQSAPRQAILPCASRHLLERIVLDCSLAATTPQWNDGSDVDDAQHSPAQWRPRQAQADAMYTNTPCASACARFKRRCMFFWDCVPWLASWACSLRVCRHTTSSVNYVYEAQLMVLTTSSLLLGIDA